MYQNKNHRVSIAHQAVNISKRYKNFKVRYNHKKLNVTGDIRPTPRSETYTFSITYVLGKRPSISVLNPVLIENSKGESIPHTYPIKKLCLYQPKYGEFKSSDYIYSTIIPWISLWLYHYEVWHITGDWHGGGEHPQNNKNEKRK